MTTVKQSLESILNQIDNRYEVVVVDNKSTDGSRSILREYARDGKIRLFEKKCSRGRGRQIAFEKSMGQYVISNLDLDDIFKPKLLELVDLYHARSEGNLLRATMDEDPARWAQTVTIAPRDLLLLLGGWPNLQLFEDWYLWARAGKLNRFSWTVFPLAINDTSHPERKTPRGKLMFRYFRYRESMRLGWPISFSKGEKVWVAQRVAKALAQLSLPFLESYRGTVDLLFQPFDPSFKV